MKLGPAMCVTTAVAAVVRCAVPVAAQGKLVDLEYDASSGDRVER
jgi:hypothetical protein